MGVDVWLLSFEEDNKAHSLSIAPQYSHISSMIFCLSYHGGGRRQDVNPERGDDEHTEVGA